MKSIKNNVLGIEVSMSVPETVEEFNALAKAKDGQNPCLDEAVNNVKYRGWNAEFRDIFLHGRTADAANNVAAIDGVEQTTGIDRKTVAVEKDGKPVLKDGVAVEKYDETEGEYFKRVCAEKNVEPASFASLAQSVADQIAFDPSATERKPTAPKKLPKDILEKATAKVGQGEEAFTKVAKLIAKDLQQPAVTWTGDAAKDSDTLGWAIKAHLAWMAKSKLDKY